MERNDGRNRSPMKTEEVLLPEAVRRKAAVSVGGEHAWRHDDVEDVVRQAEATA